MDWILLISLFGLFLSGFYIMDKLDKFIDSPYFLLDTKKAFSEKYETCDALVYGKLDVSLEVKSLLEKEKIKYIEATSFDELNQSYPYKYLFALEKTDIENLMICSLCEKLKPRIKKIAILNDRKNKNVYEKYNIPFLYADGATALQIVSAILPYKEKGRKWISKAFVESSLKIIGIDNIDLCRFLGLMFQIILPWCHVINAGMHTLSIIKKFDVFV